MPLCCHHRDDTRLLVVRIRLRHSKVRLSSSLSGTAMLSNALASSRVAAATAKLAPWQRCCSQSANELHNKFFKEPGEPGEGMIEMREYVIKPVCALQLQSWTCRTWHMTDFANMCFNAARFVPKVACCLAKHRLCSANCTVSPECCYDALNAGHCLLARAFARDASSTESTWCAIDRQLTVCTNAGRVF